VLLVTVSTLALVVSVAGLVVSTFTVVSLLVLTEVDESIFDVSEEPPELLPLQAAMDNAIANANSGSLNAFFIELFF
jgi:hypothetical protein